MKPAWIAVALAIAWLAACDGPGTHGEPPAPDASTTAPPTTTPPPMPPGEPIANWERFPDRFRIVMMRGVAPDPFVEGNSLDGFEAAAAQGIRHVEADFLLSRDGALVAAHHPNPGGDCGDVRQRTVEELRACRLPGDRRIATLSDLLAMPFDEIYLDLKDGDRGTDARQERAALRAIADIEAADRLDSTVVMLYRVTPAIADALARTGARAGTKGYPASDDDTRALIDLAAEHGMETMCVSATALTPELLLYSARKGVWQLPWDHARSANIPHWQQLARAGLGGLIVDTRAIVADNVEPHWRDVRHVLNDALTGQ